jgi:hypothetical protein
MFPMGGRRPERSAKVTGATGAIARQLTVPARRR